MKNDFARNPANENSPTVGLYTKKEIKTTAKSTSSNAIPIDTLVYFFNIKAIISVPPLDASMKKNIAEHTASSIKENTSSSTGWFVIGLSIGYTYCATSSTPLNTILT